LSVTREIVSFDTEAPVDLAEMRGDLPCGYPFRIERQHDLVHVREPTLPLLHNVRFERTFPIPRHGDLDFASDIRYHCLGTAAVPHVSRLPTRLRLILLVTEVFGDLLVERGSSTFLVNSFSKPPGPVNANPRAFASVTIAAAAACSDGSSRAAFPSL
jgi:hypothetical protein